MEHKKSNIRKGLEVSGIILLSLLMLCGAFIFFLPQFGWRIDGLRSGSMEPQLQKGDLIITRPVAPSEIKVGDIIMFKSPSGTASGIISHRVVGTTGSSPRLFQTKGDANIDADPFLTPASDVVGQFSTRVPLFGNLVIALKTFPGLLVSLVAPGFSLIYICLKSIRNELAAKREGHPGDV